MSFANGDAEPNLHTTDLELAEELEDDLRSQGFEVHFGITWVEAERATMRFGLVLDPEEYEAYLEDINRRLREEYEARYGSGYVPPSQSMFDRAQVLEHPAICFADTMVEALRKSLARLRKDQEDEEQDSIPRDPDLVWAEKFRAIATDKGFVVFYDVVKDEAGYPTGDKYALVLRWEEQIAALRKINATHRETYDAIGWWERPMQPKHQDNLSVDDILKHPGTCVAASRQAALEESVRLGKMRADEEAKEKLLETRREHLVQRYAHLREEPPTNRELWRDWNY